MPAGRKRGRAAAAGGRWKIAGRSAADPLQQRDVAAEHPAVLQKMQAHLQVWWDGVKDRVNEPRHHRQ